MSFAEWSEMPSHERWLRVMEWLEVQEARQEAAEAAEMQRQSRAITDKLNRDMARGMGQ